MTFPAKTDRVPALGYSYVSITEGALHASVWHAGADLESVRALGAELDDLAERKGQISVFMLVRERVPIAGHEARREAASTLRRLGSKVRSVAAVVEGAGARAAAIRSVFVGVALLVRPDFDWKMFATAQPALAWQRRYLKPRDVIRASVAVERLLEDTAFLAGT